jgi:hypothetical protein
MTTLLTSVLLCLSACGDPEVDGPNPDPDPNPGSEEREAGFGADDKALLWVDSSSYTTDSCSNWSEWSSGLDAFNDALNGAYVAFGGNAEGSVDLLTCSSPGRLSSCMPRNPPVRYEVNGLEYSRSFAETSPIDGFDCSLTTSYEVVLTDAGNAIVERATRTHSLEGPDCADYDAIVVSESSNGHGIDGCVATFTSQMSLRDWSPR